MKIIKKSRGLTNMKSKASFVYEDDIKNPQFINFFFSKCQIAGTLKVLRKEYNMQPQLLKCENEHDLFALSNYEEDEDQGKTFLIDDVLRLAYLISKHGNAIQKLTGVSYEKTLTESSLARNCLSRFLNESKKNILQKEKKIC